MGVRQPAVSDLFYPADPKELTEMIDRMPSSVKRGGAVPKILIAPHAGYPFSGPSAATGYRLLEGCSFERVVLIGPSHRVGFKGAAFSEAECWQTPLGRVAVDQGAIESFLKRHGSAFLRHAQPHQAEHALEVQLPFLQRVLKGDFAIIPLTYGDIAPQEIEAVIEHFMDDQTLVIISSDLSHFYDLERAELLDRACHQGVLALDIQMLGPCEACGRTGMEAAIGYARRHDLVPRLLDYSTSAKASGDRSRVVGYGCYGFFKEAT
jgi:AmmeMemoRadiSam system protein B